MYVRKEQLETSGLIECVYCTVPLNERYIYIFYSAKIVSKIQIFNK